MDWILIIVIFYVGLKIAFSNDAVREDLLKTRIALAERNNHPRRHNDGMFTGANKDYDP